MARRAVVEVQCDRCERVEYLEEGADACSFIGVLRSDSEEQPVRNVEFKELCTSCFQTVIGHLDQIGKTIKGCSPQRKAKKEPA